MAKRIYSNEISAGQYLCYVLIALLFLCFPLICLAEENITLSGIDQSLFEENLTAAQQGDIEAQLKTAFAYERGIGVEKDFAQAFIWYNQAAIMGNEFAQNTVGYYYSKGLSVKQDDFRAFLWFAKSAEAGYAVAQYNLGWCYENGKGVNQDFSLAFFWYSKAAEAGDEDAQIKTSWCYENGVGVEKDLKKAIYWANVSKKEEYPPAVNDSDELLIQNQDPPNSDNPLAKDQHLNEIIQNGKIVLREVQIDFPTADSILIDNQALRKISPLFSNNIRKTFSDNLSQHNCKFLSLSPSSKSGILLIGSIPVAYGNTEYHVIYPSSRGVADQYGNLDAFCKLGLERALGTNAVVYSPNERYAIIANHELVETGNYCVDPILIDLYTGELILTATYSSDPRSNQLYGAVTAACFSQDQLFLYYILTGNIKEPPALYRYGLQSAVTEFCCVVPYDIYDSSLFETADGSLRMLESGHYFSESDHIPGLVQIRYEDQKWTCKKENLDQVIQDNYRCFDYSANSGFALAYSNDVSKNSREFVVFRPDDTFYSDPLAIEKSTSEIVSTKIHPHLVIDIDGPEPSIDWESLYSIIRINLSQDGSYALAYVMGNDNMDRHLFLISLETFDCVEIYGLNREISSDLIFGRFWYKPEMDWNADYIMLGGSKQLRFFTFSN